MGRWLTWEIGWQKTLENVISGDGRLLGWIKFVRLLYFTSFDTIWYLGLNYELKVNNSSNRIHLGELVDWDSSRDEILGLKFRFFWVFNIRLREEAILSSVNL